MSSVLAEGLLAKDRGALAKAITLTESTRAADRLLAQDVIDSVLPATGGSARIGISGTPGVGKSTFIDAYGMALIEQGHRVAVLAVDPSSQTSGGSILGDKTRMAELNRAENAYIRPSPSGGTLGGVTVRTRDVVLLCEAAGFDTVIVETVGVGQSETAVAQLTDVFLLLLGPGGGDDLQGIKRGVMELADIVVVNKADGELRAEAQRTADAYRSALHLVRPKWDEPAAVLTASALSRDSVRTVAKHIDDFRSKLVVGNQLEPLRQRQAEHALNEAILEEVLSALRSSPSFDSDRQDLETKVLAGELSASSAASQLSRSYFS